MNERTMFARRDNSHEEPALNFSALTARELEVLALLALGESSRLLARRLRISERTVRAHCASIVRKLRLDSRLQAAIVSHLHAADIHRAASLLPPPSGESPQRIALTRPAESPPYSTTC